MFGALKKLCPFSLKKNQDREDHTKSEEIKRDRSGRIGNRQNETLVGMQGAYRFWDRLARSIALEIAPILRQLYPKPYECAERDALTLKRVEKRLRQNHYRKQKSLESFAQFGKQ